MSSLKMSSMPASTTLLRIATGRTQTLVRRVKVDYGFTYTILPWASNICKARCPYCCEIDHHAICPDEA
eukprot:16258911-Heterocapsa_arctica.AAC.1